MVFRQAQALDNSEFQHRGHKAAQQAHLIVAVGHEQPARARFILHPLAHGERAGVGQVAPHAEIGSDDAPRVVQHLVVALGAQDGGRRAGQQLAQLLYVGRADIVQQPLYRAFPALMQGQERFTEQRLRVVVPLCTLPRAIRHGRLGDALAVVFSPDFSEGRPIDRAPIKRVKQHIARTTEAREEPPGRVSNQGPFIACPHGPQNPVNRLRFACARGAAEKHVLRFQHARNDHPANLNIHVSRLRLVAVHAGLQIGAADNFRAPDDRFLAVRRVVGAGHHVTPNSGLTEHRDQGHADREQGRRFAAGDQARDGRAEAVQHGHGPQAEPHPRYPRCRLFAFDRFEQVAAKHESRAGQQQQG